VLPSAEACDRQSLETPERRRHFAGPALLDPELSEFRGKLTSYRGYQHGENHVESNKKYFMEIQPAEIAI